MFVGFDNFYKRKNIVIIGQHTGNMGDEMAGCALLQRLLKESDVEKITVLYRGYDNRKLEINNPKIVHEYSLALDKTDVINLLLSCYLLRRQKPIGIAVSNNLKKINKIFDEADTIIVSPSGANIGIYQDERLLSLLFLAIAKNKNPIFHYCTIGKSNSKLFDFIAKSALKKSILLLRERRSMEYAQKIGAKSKFGFDTAFGFENFSKNINIPPPT